MTGPPDDGSGSAEPPEDDAVPSAPRSVAMTATASPVGLAPAGGSTDLAVDVSRGDRRFRRLTGGAAVLTLLIIGAIALFLVIEAVGALQANDGNFLTETRWLPNQDPPVFGIAAIAFGTVFTSVLALAMAVPVAVGVALFISHYAPRRLAAGLGLLVDLLAAVPSVVYGLWGLQFLNGQLVELSRFLDRWLGWTYVLSSETGAGPYGRSVLVASVILAIMVLPITAAVTREVFLQTPAAHEEAALALGATRYEVVRTAVLPYARPGIIGASMLGLGRALGETIAVALVLSVTYDVTLRALEPGGNTIAANIALQFGEADEIGRGALIASGLALFVITLLVNLAARRVVARRREFRATA